MAIECSFNDSPDTKERYRAEVEFISTDEWLQDLRLLHADLVEGGEVSQEYANPDSAAGMAYAKISAVYPEQTAGTLASAEPRDLVADERVRSVLGSRKTLRAQTAAGLFEMLQPFVDSPEKSKKTREPAYWPLLRVVRLYTKARALSTGAVIVDLVSEASASCGGQLHRLTVP